MRRPLLLLAALALTACGSGTVEPPPPGDFVVSVGAGVGDDPSSLTYAPLEPGAELVLEPGAQGGFHVFIQVQVDAAHVDGMGDRPFIRRLARRDTTGELVSRSERTQPLVPSSEDGTLELENAQPLFLCPTPIGIPVADETLRLEVEIAPDKDTPGVKGELFFIPRCPAGDQNEFCNNICFG